MTSFGQTMNNFATARLAHLGLTVCAALLTASISMSALAISKPEPKANKSAKTASIAAAVSNKTLELEWDELVPEDGRGKFAAAAPMHDYLGEAGPAAQQPMDFSVNKTLDGQNIKLPGFIVPLDIGKDGLVSEFFLVPYFGACIHVPPPPPNQIVYVRMTQGIALDSIYEAYWITGKMTVQNKQTRLGAAAYTVAADKVEIYKY